MSEKVSPGLFRDVDLGAFLDEAQAWLDANAKLKPEKTSSTWGRGAFDVAVFVDLTHHAEREAIDRIRSWIRLKAERGYHAISVAPSFGGLGLSRRHAREFGRLERQYVTPGHHELIGVTTSLVAQTIFHLGTDVQRERFYASLLRADVLACQLFSEPGAGSDLAGLSCRAARDDDEWVLTGQKVWSSGAQFSDWGLLIARSDPDADKHAGLTAFMVPLNSSGVEVRPIRQMSGGTSFCEVFLDDVRVPDEFRVGQPGEGWKVALTTLSFERDHSESGDRGSRVGGTWRQLLGTAQSIGATDDPVVRDALMRYYVDHRVESLTNRRAADLARSGTPGPEGSLGKLMWTEGMRRMSDVASLILGPRLQADTGDWGTYAWGEHVLGAPGYRIAGGSDEIQRNIIGERVLGLPKEPRSDAGPWRDIPR